MRAIADHAQLTASPDQWRRSTDAVPEAQPPEARRLVEARHNLPASLSSFIGRGRDISEVRRRLADSRLVTLTGTAGVGKTRLALEVAAEVLESFTDGVWLVELAPLAEGEHVLQAVAAALGVREQAGRPLVDTLADTLRHRQQLLILDNCEHLVAACASLANRLLRECPRLRVLATTREALRLTGETIWRLAPLSLPDADTLARTCRVSATELMSFEAVQLFLARTQALMRDCRVSEEEVLAAASICRQLDGIPLALELAAARVPGLGVKQLARRLDDRFRVLVGGDRAALPRQQTLRALIEWGYALLSEPEQALLRRCSVFSDGWTLEAAEGICSGGGVDPDSVLPLLVGKSQVGLEEHVGQPRYRLLETLRQYAAEKLREAGEEATLRQRHLEWFARLAEQAEEPLWTADRQAWLDRLKAETNNLRAALEWSELASADPQHAAAAVPAGLRLGGALWHFWDMQGYASEGQTHVLALLDTGRGDPATRAKAMHAAAYLTYARGDAAGGSRLAAQAIAHGRDVLDPFLRASTLVGLALGKLLAGDAAEATALCSDGLAHCRADGDRRGMYYSLYGLAEIARVQGDLTRAIQLMEEAHRLTLEQADSWSIAFALSTLGNLTLVAGDLVRSRALQQESLRLRYSMDDAVGMARCLDGLGWLARAQGQPVRAARLFGAADALRHRVGNAPHPPWQAEHERHRNATRSSLGHDAFSAELSAGRALELSEAVEYALASDNLSAGCSRDARRASPAQLPERLTPREREVAVLVAQGYTNRAIAQVLVITERTAEGHVERIRGKLGFQSRAQVAAWAVRSNVLAA
jgi:predicted ATPase/DNA-binding CsgD family transcriptional regulator